MRALVCGAGGFIGGYLTKRLIQDGFEVRAADIKPVREWWQADIESDLWCGVDLRLRPACHEVLGGGVDVVYNLAADMGGMGYIENNKTACMMSVLINTHLLQEWCEVDWHHPHSLPYFFASSACVYPQSKQRMPGVIPLRESDAYPADPEDGYGWEKLFSERMCRHYREDRNVDARVARFHNVYGPLGTFEGGREKAPAAICRKVAWAKLIGKEEIEIWGDGYQTRSFMWIEDCIEGIMRMMDAHVPGPLNIGSSELVSINELVDMVEEIAGVKLRRIYNARAPKGVNGRNSDNTEIKRQLGWEPTTPLREGMEKTYSWIYDRLKARL